MADKIEQTIEVLIEEGNRKGFLSYAEINALLEDQFVPPERMDQIFMALEDQSIEVIDDSDSEAGVATAARTIAAVSGVTQNRRRRESPEAVLGRIVTPERIDSMAQSIVRK